MSSPSWLHNLRSPWHRAGATPAATGLAASRDASAQPRSPGRPRHAQLQPGHFPVGPNPQAVVTADFNNDGRLDLATANTGGNTVSVLGDPDGGFGAGSYAAGTGR